MSRPYEPRFAAGPGCPAEVSAALQSDVNAFYARNGITQEIVMEPLPLGGLGYKCAFYKNGVRIPEGIWGV